LSRQERKLEKLHSSIKEVANFAQ